MKRFLLMLVLTVCGTIACRSGARNGGGNPIDVFPMTPHLYYSYDYYWDYTISSAIDGVTLMLVDSGFVDYIVHDSTASGDTTLLWTVEERQSIHHSVHNVHARDTAYWQYDTTFFVLVEETTGLHELFASGLVWHFPFPDSAQSIPVSRYSNIDNPAIMETWSVSSPDCGTGSDSLWFSDARGFVGRESHFRYGDCHNTRTVGVTEVRLRGNPVVSALAWTPMLLKLDLVQNWPNPFNPSTSIEYRIAGDGKTGEERVKLAVYDLLGREVAVLVDGYQTPGEHRVTFDARMLASGIYFYRLIAGGAVQTRRMALVK